MKRIPDTALAGGMKVDATLADTVGSVLEGGRRPCPTPAASRVAWHR